MVPTIATVAMEMAKNTFFGQFLLFLKKLTFGLAKILHKGFANKFVDINKNNKISNESFLIILLIFLTLLFSLIAFF